MSSEHTLYPLGECISLLGGGTPSKDKSEFWNGGIPWASVKDLVSSRLTSTQDSISALGLASSASKIVKAGSIIIATRMAVGRVAIAEIDVAINQDLKAITCSENLDSKYLFYFLQSQESNLNNLASGATVKGIKINHILDMKIPLPPLSEQQKIAAILDAADSLRQKDQQLVEHYTALSQSLFLEMFGDPVTNPMRWPEARLADLTTFENGDRSSNYPSGTDIKDNGVLFLSTKNITEGKLDLDTVQFISEQKFKSLSRGKAKKGDLLITLRGSLGNCCIFDCEYSSAFINAQMMIIRTKNQISNLFLHSLITNRQFHSMLQVIGRGAAVQQLTATQLAQLYVMTPPNDMQTLFAERIQLIEIQKQHAKRSLEKSEGLFNSLLHNAFTGELTSKGAVN